MTGFVGSSDPQVKTVGEQRMASFSVAVNRKNGSGQKQTLWVRVNAWGKLADVAAQYVHKGSLLQVSSEWLRPSAWVDQSSTAQVSLDMDANRLVRSLSSGAGRTSRGHRVLGRHPQEASDQLIGYGSLL
jgi:single-strand DNA-binding protein